MKANMDLKQTLPHDMSITSSHKCRPNVTNWWKRPELKVWYSNLLDAFSLSLVSRMIKWVELTINTAEFLPTRPFSFYLGIRAVPNFGDARGTPALGALVVIEVALPDGDWWTLADAGFVVSLKEGEINPPELKPEEKTVFLRGTGQFFQLRLEFV